MIVISVPNGLTFFLAPLNYVAIVVKHNLLPLGNEYHVYTLEIVYMHRLLLDIFFSYCIVFLVIVEGIRTVCNRMFLFLSLI